MLRKTKSSDSLGTSSLFVWFVHTLIDSDLLCIKTMKLIFKNYNLEAFRSTINVW